MPQRFCHQPCNEEQIEMYCNQCTKNKESAIALEMLNSLNICQQVLVLAQYVLQERLLKLGDLAWLHFVQVSPHTSINDCYLFFNSHWS